MSHSLTREMRGKVLHLRFAKPPNNHLDTDLTRDLADALEAADLDKACRALVLSSEGRVFCAGADLTGDFDNGPFYDQVMRLYRTRKPIIAAVDGAAVGAGLGLAVACDFRVASPETRFAANFTRLGIHPGFGLSVTLPRLIGQQKAMSLFYTGRRIGGEEALAMGLVDTLVAPDQVLEASFALADEIAISAPKSVQALRETLREGLADEIARVNAREKEIQQIEFASSERAEGVAAMSERRPPNFADA